MAVVGTTMWTWRVNSCGWCVREDSTQGGGSWCGNWGSWNAQKIGWCDWFPCQSGEEGGSGCNGVLTHCNGIVDPQWAFDVTWWVMVVGDKIMSVMRIDGLVEPKQDADGAVGSNVQFVVMGVIGTIARSDCWDS